MAKTIIRNKKSTNIHQKKMMEECAIDEMDLAFCDLVAAGWSERLAAYYAYSLTSDNDASIDTFIRNQKQYHPGILMYQKKLEEQRLSETRSAQRRLAKAQSAQQGMMMEESESIDLRSKQGMLDYLIDLSRTPGLDVKTKTDLAKQISDLMQFKKEEIKEEDNRINFYLPITCKYCDIRRQLKELTSENTENEQ